MGSNQSTMAGQNSEIYIRAKLRARDIILAKYGPSEPVLKAVKEIIGV